MEVSSGLHENDTASIAYGDPVENKHITNRVPTSVQFGSDLIAGSLGTGASLSTK
jgi:hypothetical protein